MGSVKSNLNNHESLRLNHVVPYQAVEIDQAFALELTNGEMKNADFLLNYIEQYWGTLDHFLERGYGYVALTANKEVARPTHLRIHIWFHTRHWSGNT